MKRVSPKKMSHVVYRTYRFDQMISWYEIVFGARVGNRSTAYAFLTFDDEDHRFAFGNLQLLNPDLPEPEHPGLVGVDHIAYTLDSLMDLFSNYEFLKTKQIMPYWCIHHGDTVSMYYADPDGNQIEFQVETFAARMEALASENIEPKVNNPIGVEFDPDYWLDRLKNGAPESDLLIRKVHEPVSPIRGALERAMK